MIEAIMVPFSNWVTDCTWSMCNVVSYNLFSSFLLPIQDTPHSGNILFFHFLEWHLCSSYSFSESRVSRGLSPGFYLSYAKMSNVLFSGLILSVCSWKRDLMDRGLLLLLSLNHLHLMFPAHCILVGHHISVSQRTFEPGNALTLKGQIFYYIVS